MTKTIKILMIILFGAAGLVVARVGILINKTFHPTTAAISLPTKEDYEDSDDFDHDGYLDGEEVFSDHNPTQADNDSLAKTREFLSLNSTERLAHLVTGGILSGDLKTSNPQVYAQSVDSTATATVYSILSALEDIDVGDETKNLVEDTKETQENYLNIIFQTISKDIAEILSSQPKELVMLFSPDQNAPGTEIFTAEQKERIKTKFLAHSITFQQAFDQINNAEVPKSWVAIHKKTLTLLKKLELYYRSIALSADDPLKQMGVLGNLQSVYLDAQPILLEINGKIKSGNLTPPDSNFFDITLLLNQ